MGHTYSKDTPVGNKLFKHHERKKNRNPLKSKTRDLFTDNLGSVQISGLQKAFKEVAGDKDAVDRKELEQVLQRVRLVEDELNLSDSYTAYSSRLFKVFDTNHDNKVDINEFLAGMAVLCEGELEDKLKLTFNAFCDGRNPYITRAGMYSMLKSAYTRAVELLETEGDETNSPRVQELKKNITNTVRNMVEDAFLEVDADGNQIITFDEFVEWAKSNPVVCASLGEDTCEQQVSLV